MRPAIAALSILALALGIVTVSAPAAAHAAGVIELSDDGSTFGAAYPGVLFDDIALLVPGDSQQEKFYLRNTGDAPGFLRLTLRDVVSTNTDFAQALTVSASTPGFTGEPVVVGSVNPCWVILEKHRVEPGETVGVTTTLALGNLDGQAGQGATAGMVIRASLSDTSNGALAQTDCGGGGTDVSVLPSASGTRSAQGAISNPPLAQNAPAPGTPGGELTDLPVLNLPGGIVIDPNTWHLYEEYLVLILFASLILGSGWFMMVARRRRRRDGEEETDVMA